MKRTLAVLLASFLAYGCMKSEKPMHPDFTLVGSVFREMTARMPAETARIALEDPAGFLEGMRAVLSTPPELLSLVDKTHGLVRGAVPADLVPLARYSLRMNKEDLSMRASAAEALAAMSDAAWDAGIVLDITSAYRSYAYQEDLFAWNLKHKPREIVEKELAKPGFSQHQLGTVVDFGSADESFEGTPAAVWLAAHAEDFGFSLSYPKGQEAETGYIFEPWHFRYIGTDAASMIRKYFGGSQQAFLAYFAAEQDAFRKALRNPNAKDGHGDR